MIRSQCVSCLLQGKQIYKEIMQMTHAGSTSWWHMQAAMHKDTVHNEIQRYTSKHTHYITCVWALLMSSSTIFFPHCCLMLPSYTVGALPWRCDENACFINFVTKSMHSIVQQGRQSSSRIPMNSRCCVPVSAQNIPEQYTGKNNPRLNLHHLSAHRIISFQVNNLLSTLSYQVGLWAC